MVKESDEHCVARWAQRSVHTDSNRGIKLRDIILELVVVAMCG